MRVFSILGAAFSFAIFFHCVLSIYSSFNIHCFCYHPQLLRFTHKLSQSSYYFRYGYVPARDCLIAPPRAQIYSDRFAVFPVFDKLHSGSFNRIQDGLNAKNLRYQKL